MGLDYTLWSNCLSDSTNDMMLYMAWLDVMRVSRYKRHVFALFIFEADLPAIKELRPGLYVG